MEPSRQHMEPSGEEAKETRWHGLLRVGGWAALIAAVLFRRNMGAELSLLSGLIDAVPAVAPHTALDWFTLLQNNRLVGLIMLGLFDIINHTLVGLIFLGVYAALRRVNRSTMTVASSLAFVGAGVYFASNQAFSMLALSHQYAAATTEARRSMFLVAGEALLAIDNPGTIYQGTGIYMSLLLVLLAGLITSIVMLRSSVFGKATAYIGITANVIGLIYCVAIILAPLAFPPMIYAIPASAWAPFRVIWYILIAWRLFQLVRSAPDEVTSQQ
jgi:hypothetical protein